MLYLKWFSSYKCSTSHILPFSVVVESRERGWHCDIPCIFNMAACLSGMCIRSWNFYRVLFAIVGWCNELMNVRLKIQRPCHGPDKSLKRKGCWQSYDCELVLKSMLADINHGIKSYFRHTLIPAITVTTVSTGWDFERDFGWLHELVKVRMKWSRALARAQMGFIIADNKAAKKEVWSLTIPPWIMRHFVSKRSNRAF